MAVVAVAICLFVIRFSKPVGVVFLIAAAICLVLDFLVNHGGSRLYACCIVCLIGASLLSTAFSSGYIKALSAKTGFEINTDPSPHFLFIGLYSHYWDVGNVYEARMVENEMDYDLVNGQYMEVIKQDVKENIADLPAKLLNNFKGQWQDYGSGIRMTANEYFTAADGAFFDINFIKPWLTTWTQMYYVCVLFLAFISLICGIFGKRNLGYTFVCLCLLGISMGLPFGEVQERYKCVAVPFVYLLAGHGLCAVADGIYALTNFVCGRFGNGNEAAVCGRFGNGNEAAVCGRFCNGNEAAVCGRFGNGNEAAVCGRFGNGNEAAAIVSAGLQEAGRDAGYASDSEIAAQSEAEKNDILYIVMPAYNEEAVIADVIEQWMAVVLKYGSEGSKLVVADSGSSDGTHEILTGFQKKYKELEILEKTEKQHGPKVFALYDYAIKSGAGYVFQTDSDGQTDPNEFEKFWNERKSYAGIFGYRTVRGDGKQRAFVEKVVCFLIKIYFGVSVPDANAPFRLMRVDSVKKYLYKLLAEYDLPNIMIVTYFKYYGERVKFDEISFGPRKGGDNSMDIFKIIKIGFHALIDFGKLKRDI